MKISHVGALALLLCTSSANAKGPNTASPPSPIAAPPAGWNSYVTYGDCVTEAEVLENARYMRDHLLPYGWSYVVVDYRWYDPHPAFNRPRLREGARLSTDAYGRFTPAVTRFPSAADGQGFKPLADQLHAMGLKFGIHVMRGIPRQTIKENPYIEGTNFRAADAANLSSICTWCPDIYGVDGASDAGQAWYDAQFRLFASWGVDFVKVDDLINPFSSSEMKAVRRAIDKCGRPIIFSASPGPAPKAQKNQITRYANMWRISRDFWDKWGKLDAQFDLLTRWTDFGGPGRWPDMDILPLGRIGKKVQGRLRENGWSTKFTREEQKTMVSLWALAPSPMMLGADLPANDEWTNSLLTNPEVMALNQDPLAIQAQRVSSKSGHEVWLRRLSEDGYALGLFNRSGKEAKVSVTWNQLKLAGPFEIRDVWAKQDKGASAEGYSLTLPPHGSALLRLVK